MVEEAAEGTTGNINLLHTMECWAEGWFKPQCPADFPETSFLLRTGKSKEAWLPHSVYLCGITTVSWKFLNNSCMPRSNTKYRAFRDGLMEECLLYKHEELSFHDPWNPCKSLKWWCVQVSPALGCRDRRISEASQSSQHNEVKVQGETLLPKTMQRMFKEGIQHWVPASIWSHTDEDTPTNVVPGDTLTHRHNFKTRYACHSCNCNC